MPVEVPIESRTELWSDLSIDWTSDVPIDWSNDVPIQWWIKLPIQVPSKMPSELPIELPNPGSNAGSGYELGRERMGKWVAAAGRKRSGMLSPEQRRNRREAASREPGWIRESVNRGRYFCQRTSALRGWCWAGFRPPRRIIARRAPLPGQDDLADGWPLNANR